MCLLDLRGGLCRQVALAAHAIFCAHDPTHIMIHSLLAVGQPVVLQEVVADGFLDGHARAFIVVGQPIHQVER